MARVVNPAETFMFVFLLICYIIPVTSGANPVFDSNGILQYESIPEEDDNYEVGQLVATDADGDTLIYGIQNAAPQYLSGSTGDAFNFLRVTTDGKVFTKVPINRETFSSLRAAWTVQDHNVVIVQTPPVFLTVLDINDNDPYFATMPSRLDPLSENTANSSVVYTFEIVDPDEGASGTAQVMFGTIPNTICEAEVFELVETNTNTFDLRLVRTEDELDYAVQSEYTICIYAEDEGNPSLNSSVSSVIIPIEDLQNLAPVFLNQPYDETIPENLAVGERVLTVTAQDGDRGVLLPNEIRYEMDSIYFEIDPISGDITVSNGLDREMTSSYIFTVNATELDYYQPEEDKTTFTQVFIMIEDVDDNPPTFEADTVIATIAENTPNGSPLTVDLMIHDVDTPVNARFTLTLDQDGDAFRLQGSEYTSSARVDVRVNNSTYLNFEERQTLTFQVIATSSLYTSVANVTVYIVDTNDNPPVFTRNSYEGQFPEVASNGYYILTVEAVDGDGADVLYSTSSSEFQIGRTTGQITTGNVQYDAELQTSYAFTVTASDGEQSETVFVILECTDVNDNFPIFYRRDYQFAEEEFQNVIPDIPVGSVQAFDLDVTPPNNNIVYSILPGSGSENFRINETTGDIYFDDFVDYENNMKTLFIVVAADGGEPSLNTTTSVTVHILDTDDNATPFTQDMHTLPITQNDENEATTTKETEMLTQFLGDVEDVILCCASSSFQLDIPVAMAETFNANDFYLTGDPFDPSCRGFFGSNSHITLNSSLTQCGTQTSDNGTHIFYHNTVETYTNNSSSIVEFLGLEIPITCEYETSKKVQTHFKTITSIIKKQERGSFDFDFAMYADITYTERYNTYPVETKLNEELYFRAELLTPPTNLKIHLRNCRATPSPNYDDAVVYEFIKAGCGINNAPVRVLTPSKPTQADFAITSFRFRKDLSNADSQIWVHCEVVVCDVNDANSECSSGCEQSRRRRSVDEPQKTKRIVQGPILMTYDTAGESKTLTSDKGDGYPSMSTPILSAVVLVMFLGFVVMGVVLGNVIRNTKQLGYQPVLNPSGTIKA